jgi:2,4-dienoyl-CoA reductase-like NADH-dependent reductase (Old Yellow Enzyme family)
LGKIRFLSPYTNRRDDLYGGTNKKRLQIVGMIVSQARAMVGNDPILIKMIIIDYLPERIDLQPFLELTKEIKRTSNAWEQSCIKMKPISSPCAGC